MQNVIPLLAVAEGIEAERQALRRLHDAKTEKLLGLLENLILVSRANSYAAAVNLIAARQTGLSFRELSERFAGKEDD